MKKEIIMCNLHDDCDRAEEMAKLEGKPVRPEYIQSSRFKYLFHCSDVDCEDCFGK
jgi:hypothetical protein